MGRILVFKYKARFYSLTKSLNDHVGTLFQISSTEVEQDSDKIADEFLEGDASESNVDAFLEKFLVGIFIWIDLKT